MPRFCKQILLALTLLLPASAFAASEPLVLYAYANREVMEAIIRSTSMWINSDDFVWMVKALALTGFIGTAFAGFFGGDIKKIATYGAFLAIAAYLLLGIKTTVVVKEQVATPGVNSIGMPIGDVPAIMSVPFWGIGLIGRHITDAMNSTFADVGGTTINGTTNKMPTSSDGVGFGGSFGIMRDLARQTIRDPETRNNIQEYLINCVQPHYVSGRLDATELMKAKNYWEVLKDKQLPVNQYVMLKDEGSAEPLKLLPCKSSGAGSGGNAVPASAYEFLTQKMVDLGIIRSSGSGWKDFFNNYFANDGFMQLSGVEASSVLGDSVANVGSWATGSSEGAANMALNSAMVEMNRGAYAKAAQALDSNELMLAVNTENARRAQKSGWYTTSVLFKDMSGYFYSVLQVVLFGLVPIVIFLSFMPGFGMKIIGGYARVLFWLMLWEPGLSIINFIMQKYYTVQIADGARLCSDAAVGCMASLGVVNGATENMMLAAGFIATLMPALLWGVVSVGSFALTSVLERGSGAGFATQAAGNTSSGTLTAGSVNLGTSRANQHVATYQNEDGLNASVFNASHGTTTREDGGGNAAKIHDQQITSQITYSKDDAIQESATRARQAREGYEKTSQVAWSDMNKEADAFMKKHATMEDGKLTWDSKESFEKAQAMQKTQELFAKENKGFKAEDSKTGSWDMKAAAYVDAHAEWNSDKQIIGKAVELVSGSSGGIRGGVKGEMGMGLSGRGSKTNTSNTEIGSGQTNNNSDSTRVGDSTGRTEAGGAGGSKGKEYSLGFSTETMNSLTNSNAKKQALETALTRQKMANETEVGGVSYTLPQGVRLGDVAAMEAGYDEFMQRAAKAKAQNGGNLEFRTIDPLINPEADYNAAFDKNRLDNQSRRDYVANQGAVVVDEAQLNIDNHQGAAKFNHLTQRPAATAAIGADATTHTPVDTSRVAGSDGNALMGDMSKEELDRMQNQAKTLKGD